MNITLSIVVVEYFSEEDIYKCADSIDSHLDVPYEIIVSSNSCYDKAKPEELVHKNKRVRWIFNAKNGGFAYAMNQGLKEAKGNYLVIMNSDCTIQSNLDSMIAFLQKHEDVGAIAPKIVDAAGNIQDTARQYVSVPRYMSRQVKRVLKHKESVLNSSMNYSRIQTVDWVIGAFIMVSRKAYEATGGLDDNFFMYAEDLDWCTRIRQHGMEVVYYPDTFIIYKGTRRARNNFKYAKIFIRSHLYYWKKFGFFWGYPKRKKIYYEE